MDRLVLVVDFGTSNVHVNTVNCENGDIPFSASEKYQMICPQNGYIEMDPSEMWSKSEKCVGNIVSQINNSDEKYILAAISFSFFGDNIIPVDDKGAEQYNLLQCFDERGRTQAKKLSRIVGSKRLIDVTGDISEFTSCSSKIRYILEECQDVALKTAKYYNLQQYVLKKLGLPDVNDLTMACTKRMIDLKRGVWFEPLLEAVGIKKEQLGEITSSCEVIGTIKSYGNAEFPNEIEVVPGAHDCDCGWLGAGIYDEKEDTVGNITGSFEHFGFLANGYRNIYADHPDWNLFSYRGPLPDTSVMLTAFDTSGSLLEWFMRVINSDTSKKAYADFWSRAEFNGDTVVRVIPDFSSGRGRIEGLNLGHTKLDIFKAVIEALTFESRIMLETCGKAKKGEIQRVRMGGGHARSPEWVQLRADVTGKTYECMEQLEVSSVGAAILAAVGTGIYPDAESAVEKMVRIQAVYEPNMDIHNRYEEIYQKYCRQR